MKRYLVLLACVSALVVVAGCGGNGGGGSGEPLSKEDYEAQMQALQEDLGATATELQDAFKDPTDIPALSEGLQRTADLMDQASQDLDEISPPEEVADAHQVMVEKSAAAADKLQEFADTIANATLAELQEKLAEFQEIEEFDDLSKAVDEIQSKGYDIGGS